MNFNYSAALAILLFGFSGCQEKEPEQPSQLEIDRRLISDYLSERDIQAEETSSGIFYEILRTTNGEPIQRDEIASVYYKISLLSGKTLEARHSGNSEPLKFIHGDGGLIPVGINEGVSLMKKGEIYRFYIPSDFAFSSYHAPGLMGPNSPLIAEVELVEIETQEEHAVFEEDSIRRHLKTQQISDYEEISDVYYYITDTAGGRKPSLGEVVQVRLTRKYLDGSLVDGDAGKTVDVYLPNGNGYTGDALVATQGLATGIASMKTGEAAVVLAPSHKAFGGRLIDYGHGVYGGSIQVFPEKFRGDFLEKAFHVQDVYPLATLKYEIELIKVY